MTNFRFVCALIACCLLLAANAALADYEAGTAAFRSGNFELAAAEFQKFVAERPDEPQGYHMLGRALIFAGRPGDAVGPLRKAVELNPDDVPSRVYLGRAFDESNKPAECIAALNRLDIGSLPKQAQIQVYQRRGRSHAKLGNTGSAAVDLGRVADLKPGDARARFDYGKKLQDDAQLDAAIAAFERATSMDGSMTEWKEALVNALKIKGRGAEGEAKTAVYRRAEAVARSLVGSDSSYENLLLLAEVQLGGKNYESAVSTLQQAISKRAGDWHAHYYLGQAYGSLGRFNDAEAPLNDALTLASGQAERQVFDYLGFVLEKQKKFGEAIRCYERAGNAAGAARVRENQQIAADNKEADEHNATVDEIKKRLGELQEELDEITGGTKEPPRR
ncbi:MAG: tetratricopeptide repeat protein [Holophagales bacterium]|nr:tetratricopeptide repeat protein [Holophagales bacterium]MYD22912.1 tetratricopeptide repeat protein [Holophagales bacterium]MYI32373.1 tetratricopeptide repeat protein [Holophagales bacterium]